MPFRYLCPCSSEVVLATEMPSARGIISSPCNEWRGFTLQPKDKKSLGSSQATSWLCIKCKSCDISRYIKSLDILSHVLTCLDMS